MTTPLERRLARLEAQQKSPARKPAAPGRVKPPTALQCVESCEIEDAASGKLILFKLWTSQRKMLAAMKRHDRLVLLKSRQLGCSWLALAYLLYLALFEAPGQLYLVARQSLEESGEAIHRLKMMHDSLPAAWQQEVTVANVFSLAFANGSRIRALSSTKAIGRGLAAYLTVADELAFWAAPEEQLAALEPGSHRLLVVSTGNGPGDYLHQLWLASLTGQGRWHGEFFDWRAHPGRDQRWYVANVEQAPSPSLARREYPCTPEEAFASPTGMFFERFNSEVNVKAVSVVPDWPTVRGVDFGYHHPACVWLQTSPAGQRFVVRELLPEKVTTAEFIDAILRVDASLSLAYPPTASYVDPAGASTNVQTQTSEVELFRRAGLHPTSRASVIRDGCTRMMDALADPELPLVISPDCPRLIEALSTIKPDRLHDDVYDEGSPFTHVLDALRYALVNLGVFHPYVYEPLEPSPGPSSGMWGRIW